MFFPKRLTRSGIFVGLMTPQPVQADRVFLYQAADRIDRPVLVDALDMVVDNFRTARITFSDAQVIGDRDFPQPTGLDMVLFVVPNSGDLDKVIGHWGIQGGIYLDDSDKLGGFPYDVQVAGAHTGFLNIDGLIDDFLAKSTKPLSVDRFMRFLSSWMTHELGHGLGACHFNTFDIITNPELQQYFMTDYVFVPGSRNRFFPGNVTAMHDYIEEAREQPYDAEQRIALTKEYLGRRHRVHVIPEPVQHQQAMP